MMILIFFNLSYFSLSAPFDSQILPKWNPMRGIIICLAIPTSYFRFRPRVAFVVDCNSIWKKPGPKTKRTSWHDHVITAWQDCKVKVSWIGFVQEMQVPVFYFTEVGFSPLLGVASHDKDEFWLVESVTKELHRAFVIINIRRTVSTTTHVT